MNIAKANITYTAPTNLNPIYTGSPLTLISTGTANGGEIQYSSDGTSWSTERPKGINAGNYTVYFRIVADANHIDKAAESLTATIAKADITTYTAPDPLLGLVYTGSPLTLISAGTAEGGEMQYSLDGETWSTELPKGTNAGTYTVQYRIIGDSNHNNKTGMSVTATIAKADITTYTAPAPLVGLIYTGSPLTLISAGTAEGGEMQYSLDGETWSTELPKGTNAGNYTVQYRIIGDSNHNDLGPFFVQSTITRRPIVIQANDQTVELNKAIAEGTDQVTVKPGADEMATALATGDHLGAITLTGDTTMLTASGEITPSDWEIEDFQERDVTENYAIEAKNGVLTVKETEHVWGEPTYEWTDDNRSVTAKRVDTRDASFVQTETAAANATVSRWPTCTSGDKTTTYRATFENPAFTMQTKAITENVGIDENAHRWGDWVVTKEPTATQDGEATRTCQYSEANTCHARDGRER